MGNELQPLGERAWKLCGPTRCGDAYWCVGHPPTVPLPANGMYELVELAVTDLRYGDHIELTISGAARGCFTYFAHPDVHTANQPVELQSQSFRRLTTEGPDAWHTLHGVAVFVATSDIGANTTPKQIIFSWYLEGTGDVQVRYTVSARVMRCAGVAGCTTVRR